MASNDGVNISSKLRDTNDQRCDVNNQTNIWSEAYTSKKQTWKVNPFVI